MLLVLSDKDTRSLSVGMQTGRATVQSHKAALALWSSNHSLWCLSNLVEMLHPHKSAEHICSNFVIVKTGIKTLFSK